MHTIPEEVLTKIDRRLALIDAAGCRGLGREVDAADEMFGAIVAAAEEARRELAALRTPHDERARTLQQIRASAGALTTEALRETLWETADLDAMVDDFARSHPTSAYRDPNLQKSAHDAITAAALGRIDGAAELREALDRMYSRFLLAADVGFEIGFAAAHSMSGRRLGGHRTE